MRRIRHLIIVLGDQLTTNAQVFAGFDPAQDCVWMAENNHEATLVWNHKARLVLFFSAMRHFRASLEDRGWPVDYHALQPDGRHDSGPDFASILRASAGQLKPQALLVTQPGDWRVQQSLQRCAEDLNLPLRIVEDQHFYASPEQFRHWEEGRKRLVMEDFYREVRKQHGILMQGQGEDQGPVGGQWNLDKANREAFDRNGPRDLPEEQCFEPDAITREVMELVEKRYPDHPGTLQHFDWPVTRQQALEALAGFIEKRLPDFGRYQDAIWAGEHFLYHSRLAASLNLHLLTPRECVDAAVRELHAGRAPLNSVEGFVRQILGWREFVRGVYWLHMPQYEQRNALEANLPVPAFFWDGDTHMACVADAMDGVIAHAYAHHIIRLMVLGLFALLAGVDPRALHHWHLAMYADAIDWVSLPNVLGMSQFADDGLLGTKPYCASGNYINKMSNHCKGCRYDYRKAAGEGACPFTTLYWDFLDRHSRRLQSNRRMVFQMRNLAKKQQDPELMDAIRADARQIKQAISQKQRF